MLYMYTGTSSKVSVILVRY